MQVGPPTIRSQAPTIRSQAISLGYPRRQANQIGQKGSAITAQECELLFCGDEDELDLELLEFTQSSSLE